MKRTVIVARISPGAESDVARVFAESDASTLPDDIGVRERSLYSLGDLYVHIVDFERDAEEAMSSAQQYPGFRDISERLSPYISPYSPHWRSPRDAMANPFYRWRARG